MSKEISFHFKGENANSNTLPIDYAINLLEGVRDLVHLTVAAQDGAVYNERFRPSQEIKNRVIIKCKSAEVGSYSQTMIFDSEDASFLPGFRPEDICCKIKSFFVDLSRNLDKAIAQTFTDGRMFRRAIRSIKKLLPPLDSGVWMEVDNDPAVNSRLIYEHCSRMIDGFQSISEDYTTVVTGRLVRIDFEQKKLVIQHPLTKGSLDCNYNEEVEPMLLEHPRELIQVIGNVIPDEDGNPTKITGVVGIQEMDDSPIELCDIQDGGLHLRFNTPVRLVPELDESQQLLLLKDSRIGLDIFAYTRAEIVTDVLSEISFLWREYAMADDADLSDDALSIKRELRALLTEVPHE